MQARERFGSVTELQWLCERLEEEERRGAALSRELEHARKDAQQARDREQAAAARLADAQGRLEQMESRLAAQTALVG